MPVRACIPDGTWLLKMTRYQPSHSSFVLSVLFPAYVHHVQPCRSINSNILLMSSFILTFNQTIWEFLFMYINIHIYLFS